MKWQKLWLQASLIGLTLMSPGAVLAQTTQAAKEAKSQAEEQERRAQALFRTYSYLDMLELALALSEAYEQNCNFKTCNAGDLQAMAVPLIEAHPGGAFMLETSFRVRPAELHEILGDAGFISLNKALMSYGQGLDQARSQAFADRSTIESVWKTASGLEDTSTSRAKKSSVKANMHTLQTMVETYAVDWGGAYPANLGELKAEATLPGREYWREVANPYTGAEGLGGSLLDYAAYRPMPWASGMAIYEPVQEPGQDIVKYHIYGTDEAGQLIQDKQQDFYLTNS